MYRFTRMGSHRSSSVVTGAACVLLLGGCPTVDLGDTPTEVGLCNPAGGLSYFQSQIWPNYVQRPVADQTCARSSCHVAGGNALEFPNPIDFPTAYRRVQVYLNCGSPESSLFLTKPLTGVEPHGGGDIFSGPGDPAVQIFLDWFK